ncbi:MAG: hypothetical protein DWQ51_21900 [Microcystis wesenbergii TW10]|uniref:Uncharacterized protein n=2 Tax=Microcystis TaxID=1125 RepID=A0A0A1W2P0_MICAE|nr:MAG: hypothetical protein DWQ51_21900 [Microcystis wesenbergii TW10]GAL95796.1 hypothetical protein N44_04652 [Microcystis aeruginosa NIES-44]
MLGFVTSIQPTRSPLLLKIAPPHHQKNDRPSSSSKSDHLSSFPKKRSPLLITKSDRYFLLHLPKVIALQDR